MSRETTFERDLHAVRDKAELGASSPICASAWPKTCSARATWGARWASLRYDDFKIATRDQTLPLPILDAAAIRQAAGQCLKRVPLERRIRLLGVKVASLIRTADWLASEHDPVAREALLRPAGLTSVKNSDPYTASLF